MSRRRRQTHGVPGLALRRDGLAIRSPPCLLVGLGLRELSMEAAAIPEIKEALRRVTVAECERAAEAALALDTAEAVEELVAGTFAPRLFDLLTGSTEENPFPTTDTDAEGRPPMRTIPDRE